MSVLPLELPTPLGPRGADYFERFEVLGLSNPLQIGMVAQAPEGQSSHPIEAPPGTEFIVPMIEGWKLAYFRPARDHNIGLAFCNIVPQEWDLSPRSSDPAEVELTFSALLADQTADDRFTATIRFSLLFLRRSEGAYVPAPPATSPLEIVALRAQSFKETGLSGSSTPLLRRASSRVPAIATRVVPAMSGFVLGYGDHDGLISPHLPQPEVPAASGLHSASVIADVPSLGAPTGDTRQAEVRAALLLRDSGADDPWYGALDTNLLAFAPRTAVESAGQASVSVVGLITRSVVLWGVEGSSVASETFRVDVPGDSTDVLPLLLSWALHHGEIIQSAYKPVALWDSQDRRFGVAQVGVQVLRVRRGRIPALRQTEIQVSLRLHDTALTGNWQASVSFTLLCLQA